MVEKHFFRKFVKLKKKQKIKLLNASEYSQDYVDH